MSHPSQHMPLVDTLKAVASQLIVLHHLAFYGPMSDIAYPLAAGSIDWLYEYGRMAVQVFLVVAGFFAARSLAPAVTPIAIKPLQLIWARYQRLVIPFLVALAASIVCAAVARHWLDHASIPDTPTLWQMISHALLLQNLLGQEALSAGVWYVAIDFQLFIMLSLSLWLAGKHHASTRLATLLVGGLAVASLFYFNRQDSWDNWGIYFFGSYALGVSAHWCSRRENSPLWFAFILGLVASALLIDFRLRIAIALCTALGLGLSTRYGLMEKWPDFRLIAWLSKISYSLFLIHFPVCMLVNTLVFRLAPNSPVLNIAGMLAAWLLSIAAGDLFYRLAESKIGTRRRTQRQTPQTA
ncbi:MAG: hypothetical protein H6R19_3284 [Proteobacteria bacterium]|nr:hypothetical protein [Pseudomonadota bacterium]